MADVLSTLDNSSAMNGTEDPSNNLTLVAMEMHEPTEEELRHSLLVFYIFMFTVIFFQSGLVQWRKAHRRSYELVTLIGLWLIPPIISMFGHFWRFIAVWLVYTAVTGSFLYRCTFERTLDKSLPKLIYRWFFGVFKTSVAVGAVGYALLILEIFGGGMFLSPMFDPGMSLVALWYGLYFGILTRDCAEVATDRIANRMGGARRMAVSVRNCSICGGELKDAHAGLGAASGGAAAAAAGGGAVAGGGGDGDASVQLSCKHLFHKDCMRGWLIVGKKDSCPTCHEKVDLRAFYAGKPWETSNLSWIQMLDFFRYLIVWQPTVLMILHFALHVMHLDEDDASMQAGQIDVATVNLTDGTTEVKHFSSKASMG